MVLGTERQPIVACKTETESPIVLRNEIIRQHARNLNRLVLPLTHLHWFILDFKSLHFMTNPWLTNVVHLILRDNIFHRLIGKI
jgi:hypothetical protein